MNSGDGKRKGQGVAVRESAESRDWCGGQKPQQSLIIIIMISTLFSSKTSL